MAKAISKITGETRRDSYLKTNTDTLRAKVMGLFNDYNGMTARDIATELYESGNIPYPARAIIQPRVTELVEAGLLETFAKAYDAETNRRVAVYRKAGNNER